MAGGFIGYASAGAPPGNSMNGIVRYCFSKNCTIQLTGTHVDYAGGFVGYTGSAGVYQNCHADMCNIIDNSTARYVGGFVGRNDRPISNCYSTGAPEGISNLGGFCGLVSTNSSITNSYYDTQTSGQSDTGKGLPRTTAQMKAGTASSFILPDGSIDPDSLAANAMYTSWSTDIWDFKTTNDYPELL